MGVRAERTRFGRLAFAARELARPSMWVPAPPREPLEARDPAFIRSQIPLLEGVFRHWHDIRIDGIENVPEGPVLAVGNHNGGLMAPDMFAVMLAQWRHFGVDSPSYGLGHDLLFRVPLVARYLAHLGGIPARPDLALAALERGARVLVYPGGDSDEFRPSRRKGEIVFEDHRGFVEVALRARVPILPIVSAGAHEGFYVATDGARLAHTLRLDGVFRLKILPVGLALPWGVFVGPLPYLPLPLRIRIRVLPPVRWPEAGPSAADDRELVARRRDEVRALMQTALDEMNDQDRWGRRFPHPRLPVPGGVS